MRSCEKNLGYTKAMLRYKLHALETKGIHRLTILHHVSSVYNFINLTSSASHKQWYQSDQNFQRL